MKAIIKPIFIFSNNILISWMIISLSIGLIQFTSSVSITNSSITTSNFHKTIVNLPGDEICGNGIDDDGDGYIDADDPDCITAGSCGCPPSGIVYDTISSGHTIPLGEIHCITEDVTLDDTWSNIILDGSLYLVDTAHLYIDGGADIGANSNLVVCNDASYLHKQTSNTYNDIYNFGWLQIAGTVLDVNNVIMGENSLTAFKGTGLNINGDLAYVGDPANNSYLFLNPTSLNGNSSGDFCFPGGTSQMVVEVTSSVTPTCVTDCDGCPEMSGITTTYNDGSVEAAYLALPPITGTCQAQAPVIVKTP